MSNVYRQSNLKANVALERGTENVPNDGRFHLIVEGNVTASFRTLKEGKTAYEKELATRNITTKVTEITIDEEHRKKLFKEMACDGYASDSSANIKIPKKSGNRRYG